ncbi:MAG: HAD-IIIA family hydrolase [Bdellovibrio sp.]
MLTRKEIENILKVHGEKLKKIKACAFDVDGILTDGKVMFTGSEMGWNRSFNILDGYGMKLLMKHGLKVGVITGGNSLAIDKRFGELLDVDFVFKGSENKVPAFENILKLGFKDEEVLYIGDDLFDIPLLKRAGFSATTSLASFEVLEVADYVTQRGPGEGCAREVIDLVRYAQGIIGPELWESHCQ